MKPTHYRYLVLFLVLTTYVWMTRFFMPFPADFEDSHIMYRYTQNGVDGFLYEWNRHSGAAQGTTGVAWVTLVTLLARLTRFDVITVNSYAGLVFAVLTLLTLYLTVVRNFTVRSRWIAIFTLIPVVSCPYFIRIAANGLETSITLFFIALSIYFLRYCRPTLAASLSLGLFAGFTVLVRPDLLIFPVSLFLASLALQDGSRVLRAKNCIFLLSGALLSALLSLLFARVFTGTALPLAASLKFALTDLIFGRLPASLYRFILGSQLGFLGYLLPLILLSLISLALLKPEHSRKYLPVYFASGVYFSYLFFVLPIMDVAYRFQLPLLIGLSFSIVHFYELLARSGVSGQKSHLLVFSIALLLVLANTPLLFSGKKEAEGLKTDHADYEQLGKELGKIDGLIIASSEAGKLASFSHKKFFDTVGLNDTFVAHNKKDANYPLLLSDYLSNDFGIPDVYIRPVHPAIDKYAFLEILPEFTKIYACNTGRNAENIGLVICVYRRSAQAAAITSSLAASGINVEFP